MAKVDIVFQPNIFQSNAYQDNTWGLNAFQRGTYQSNVFDTIQTLLKVINETLASTENTNKLRVCKEILRKILSLNL